MIQRSEQTTAWDSLMSQILKASKTTCNNLFLPFSLAHPQVIAVATSFLWVTCQRQLSPICFPLCGQTDRCLLAALYICFWWRVKAVLRHSGQTERWWENYCGLACWCEIVMEAEEVSLQICFVHKLPNRNFLSLVWRKLLLPQQNIRKFSKCHLLRF